MSALDAAVSSWLCILALVEGVTIYRTSLGESLPVVFPLFAAPKDAAFTLLFQTFAGVLAIVRLSVALTPVSVAAWRSCALVHALEALFYCVVAFSAEHSLPTSLPDFVLAKHGSAAALLGAIIANAVLFTGVWLVKDMGERAFYAERAERMRRRASREARDAVLARKEAAVKTAAASLLAAEGVTALGDQRGSSGVSPSLSVEGSERNGSDVPPSTAPRRRHRRHDGDAVAAGSTG